MRGTRTWKAVALTAVAAALMLPATAAGGEGPTASKSGVLVNYVTNGKLKIGKNITYEFTCSANCNLTATDVLKGPGGRTSASNSGTFAAGVVGGVVIKPNGPLLKALKADTGKFKLATTLQATNLATGAAETIKRTFKFKR